MEKNPRWKPLLLGGDGSYPKWFILEFYRIFRPPLSRILKKANRQIKQTKNHFSIDKSRGILLFVNEGFTGIGHLEILSLVGNILLNSYSSIDCFIYLTLNRYLEIKGSSLANLIWSPIYSNRCEDYLVEFVDSLGRAWFDFLEKKIGPFEKRTEGSINVLINSKSIIH